ncbi:MAG: phage tail tape measure protein [Chitinophagaceae bacterium]|nr:phage tail tape measure protein [Chitinophagaceae bacterium]
MADTNLNIHVNAQGNLNAVLSQAMQQLDQVGLKGRTASQGMNVNQQSFFSQSTMALMSGTGQMIKGLGDKMAGFTNNIRMARAATESARNGLASMGTTAAELDKMELTARNIGESFGIAKSEILDAAYALKGGMSYVTADTLNELMGLGVQLGAATKATSNTVSNMLANAGNTIGASLQGDAKAFKEFQFQFANSAAAVVNIGKAEGDQVAAFTKNVGSALYNLNQDLATQQSLATVLITTAGSGERAATQVTSGIAAKWTTYMKGLERVGIKTTESDGRIRSIVSVIGDLKQMMDKTFDPKDAIGRENFMKSIFGSEKSGVMEKNTTRAINALIDNSLMLTSTYEKMQGAIEEGSKAARGEIELSNTMMGQMAQAFQRGPAFTMEQMKVKQQNLMEEMATSIKNSTSPLINLKSKFLDFAKSIVANKPQLVGTFLGMSEMIGTSVSSIGRFITQTGNVFRSFESIKLFMNTMKGLNIFKGGAGGLLKNILPSGNDFKIKFKPDYTPQPSMLSNLARAISTTVSNGFKRTGAVLSSVVLNALDGIKNKIATKIAAPIGSAISKAVNSVNAKLAGTGFGNFTSKLGSGFSNIGKGIGDRIKGIDWKGTLKGIGSGLLKVGGLALGAGALMAPMMMKDPAFAQDIREMSKVLKDTVGLLLKDIMVALKPLMPTVKMVFKDLLKSLMPIVKKLLELIMPLLPPLVQIIDQIAKALIPLLPPIMDILGVVIDSLLQLIPPILDILLPIINAVLPLMKSILIPTVQVIGDVIKGILKAVYSLIPERMLSQEQKQRKYIGLAQDRKDAASKGDAMRQYAAYAWDATGLKEKYGDLTYDNFEEQMAKFPAELRVGLQNVINAGMSGRLDKMSVEEADKFMFNTITEAGKGRLYSKEKGDKLADYGDVAKNSNKLYFGNMANIKSAIDAGTMPGYNKNSSVYKGIVGMGNLLEKSNPDVSKMLLTGQAPPVVKVQSGNVIVKNAGPNVEIEKEEPTITTQKSQHDYKIMGHEANLDFNRTSSSAT